MSPLAHRRAAARRLPRLARCGADPLTADHQAWQDRHDRRMAHLGLAPAWQRDRARQLEQGAR